MNKVVIDGVNLYLPTTGLKGLCETICSHGPAMLPITTDPTKFKQDYCSRFGLTNCIDKVTRGVASNPDNPENEYIPANGIRVWFGSQGKNGFCDLVKTHAGLPFGVDPNQIWSQYCSASTGSSEYIIIAGVKIWLANNKFDVFCQEVLQYGSAVLPVGVDVNQIKQGWCRGSTTPGRVTARDIAASKTSAHDNTTPTLSNTPETIYIHTSWGEIPEYLPAGRAGFCAELKAHGDGLPFGADRSAVELEYCGTVYW